MSAAAGSAVDMVPSINDVESSSHNPTNKTNVVVDEIEVPSLAPGAPVERVNPLGREVTLLSAVMLNLGQLLGSGIYSVPGSMLTSVGSTGLLLVFWAVAPIFQYSGLMVYSELASMFPNRSGGQVVYLEQAYPKPRFLVPIALAVTTVLTSFSATNSIVFAQYTLDIFDVPLTPNRQTALALGVATFSVLSVGISTKWSLRAVNFFSSLKALSLAFVVVTGIVVLAGGTRIKDPWANFRNPFEGSNANPNALATAFVKTNFAFAGWHNSFNVLAEVKSSNPVRTIWRSGFIALTVVAILYFFTNVAYVAAIPREDIRNSGQLVAALFFREIFGNTFSAKILPIMVVCSCVGNIIAVTVGQARVLREIARQGLLPFAPFFSSTRPWGTPLGPVLLKYGLTVLVIVALPAKDAFNFLLDLASYPNLIFTCVTAVSIWLLRKSRAAAGLPPTSFSAKNSVVILYLTCAIYMVVMPWVPPEDGKGDVSFWYATYCVVGLGILAACGIYYYMWIVLLPKWGGYEVVEEVKELPDGAKTSRLVRRYKKDIPTEEEEEPLLE